MRCAVLTDEELKEMKQFAINKRRNLSVGMGISKEEILIALTNLDTLIAEVERPRAIIAANPVMSKSVKKRLAAQGLDATSEGNGKIAFPRKGYDLAGPDEHHVVRREGQSPDW